MKTHQNYADFCCSFFALIHLAYSLLLYYHHNYFGGKYVKSDGINKGNRSGIEGGQREREREKEKDIKNKWKYSE